MLGLRLRGGFHVPFGNWFVEADVDFPLAGGSGAPNAFAEQSIVLATGVMVQLPD